MCNYIVKQNQCSILEKQCPYMFFCNKTKQWKSMNNMPKNCKIKEQIEAPVGYYKVCFEKRGNLYINIDGHIEIIKNPFDSTPLYVKILKTKNGKFRIKRYEG